jgi:hypothetical protein
MIISSQSIRPFALGICLVLICLVTASCSDPRVGGAVLTPQPTVLARDLLLDEQGFPKDWDYNHCQTNCDRSEGSTHAERSFFPHAYVPGHVIQEVFRFPSTTAASAQFRIYRETDFGKSAPPQIPSTAFLPPP